MLIYCDGKNVGDLSSLKRWYSKMVLGLGAKKPTMRHSR